MADKTRKRGAAALSESVEQRAKASAVRRAIARQERADNPKGLSKAELAERCRLAVEEWKQRGKTIERVRVAWSVGSGGVPVGVKPDARVSD